MDLNAVNEEWFLGQLESAKSNVTELVEVLGQLVEVLVWMILNPAGYRCLKPAYTTY